MRYKFVHDFCRFYWNDTVRILPLPYCIVNKYEYCKVLYVPYYRTYCHPLLLRSPLLVLYCTRTFYEYLLLVPTTYYLLPTTYYLQPTTYHLLPITYYLLNFTY